MRLQLRKLIGSLTIGMVLGLSHPVEPHEALERKIAEASKELAKERSYELLLQRGALFCEHGQYGRSRRDYMSARSMPEADQGEVSLRLAELEYAARNPERAIAQARLLPASERSLQLIARSHKFLKQPAQTFAAYHALIEHVTETGERPKLSYYQEAVLSLAALNRYDEALRYVDQGLMSWPESIQLNALAADLELSQNHVDAAIARLESIAQKAQRPEFWKFKQVEVLVAADRGEEALNRLRNLDKQLEIQLKQPDGRSLRVLNAKVHSLLRELEKTEADSRP